MRIAAVIVAAFLAAFAQPPDPVIESARAQAARYAQSIPNYIVRRTTTRFQAKSDRDPEWRQIDTVSAEVANNNSREDYSDIRIDGKPSKNLPPNGIWSNGEFSTLLEEILAPKHRAVFKSRSADTRQGRLAWRYNFTIDAKHSGWDMVADVSPFRRMRIAPGYSGVIWIDQQTGNVLRIEKSTRSTPRPFPLQLIQASTDYSPVEIAGQTYMLPTHSETLTCRRDKTECLRNETLFENYRRFGADASITYEK
jgi:hypothetical protein